jgi:hypothetical protein
MTKTFAVFASFAGKYSEMIALGFRNYSRQGAKAPSLKKEVTLRITFGP